ncbi:cytochrome b [Defluviimonas sp. SAOS-178_SWC]|uniref:cytochrome b n=1 Tax=Defluviimonas sp. SAOS-178_SWC TaxID=3121287 RepID=UPI0032214DF1
MSEVKGYSRTQIMLHWGIVLILVTSYISSDAMKSAWFALHQGRDAYGNTAAAHVWGGIAILVLAVLRIAIRGLRGAPGLPKGGHPLLDRAAKLTHFGLYLGLIAIPALGIAAWYGGINLAGEAHEVLFNVLAALAALHVIGAVYHQFVLKDGLMERMKRPG